LAVIGDISILLTHRYNSSLTPHHLFDILFTEKTNHFGIFLIRHGKGREKRKGSIPPDVAPALSTWTPNGYLSENKLYAMPPICISENKPSGRGKLS
jgi:hypothetical protein